MPEGGRVAEWPPTHAWFASRAPPRRARGRPRRSSPSLLGPTDPPVLVGRFERGGHDGHRECGDRDGCPRGGGRPDRRSLDPWVAQLCGWRGRAVAGGRRLRPAGGGGRRPPDHPRRHRSGTAHHDDLVREPGPELRRSCLRRLHGLLVQLRGARARVAAQLVFDPGGRCHPFGRAVPHFMGGRDVLPHGREHSAAGDLHRPAWAGRAGARPADLRDPERERDPDQGGGLCRVRGFCPRPLPLPQLVLGRAGGPPFQLGRPLRP
jgi:hypothetical protein